MTTNRPPSALNRVATLVRLPTSPDAAPEVLPDGSGLRCPTTGRVFPYRDGVLDLLGAEPELVGVQHWLNTSVTAWAYDRLRDRLLSVIGMPPFSVEVRAIADRLRIQPGDGVLDIACGHGNFTVEWARRVGAGGLVIGADISPSMLRRAAARVRAQGLDNVVLIRCDAQALPFADACIDRVNCSGGFHQIPDLSRALAEIGRTSRHGAALTASMFALAPGDRRAGLKRWLERRSRLHFIALDQLAEQLRALGFVDARWGLPGGWFGYFSARKR